MGRPGSWGKGGEEGGERERNKNRYEVGWWKERGREGEKEGKESEHRQAFLYEQPWKKNVVIIAGSQTMIHSGQLGYENVA